MKKTLAIAATVAMGISAPVSAEYLYGYGDMSINYLDWSEGTEHGRAAYQKDFAYLELEGGAGFDWGEMYGFFDIENAQANGNKLRTAYKGTIAYKLGESGVRLYGQHYAADSNAFAASNTVMGLQYKIEGDGWFVTPWVGGHYTITHGEYNPVGFSGFNGGMLGWTAVYNFKAFNENFWISNWHETEFARQDEYTALSGETDKLSANGALAFWWNITDTVTTGVQYRYAFNKLGTEGNQNALVYSLRYNF